MNTRRHVLAVLLLTVTLFSAAQEKEWTPAREEIHNNHLLSASNYLAYIDPVKPLTPAPKGYEPFYLSHYGRHGSRWLINASDYTDALYALRRAHENGKLTARGELLLAQLEEIYSGAKDRLGDLTTVGERQHHRIGRRWPERFPEIFCDPHTQIDARATIIYRCIISMTAACEELAAANPKARFHNDVGQSLQYYLNAPWSEQANEDNRERRHAVTFNYNDAYLDATRFWSVLFNDSSYRDSEITSRRPLMKKVFNICGNQQSHDTDISLYDLFTEDELYDLWRCSNIEWYVGYSQGTAPYTQEELLRNIIATADTIVDSRTFHGATLRYGHEVCLMPLAALLELDGCYPEIPAAGVDTLDRHWANYRIFPMASNVQLVFYRPRSGKGDILVKALLNENETTLPVKPVEGPYYRWADLRAYYERKLQTFDESHE